MFLLELGGMMVVGVHGMVCCLAMLVGGVVVGRWVDATQRFFFYQFFEGNLPISGFYHFRIKLIFAAILIQNSSIILACFIMSTYFKVKFLEYSKNLITNMF